MIGSASIIEFGCPQLQYAIPGEELHTGTVPKGFSAHVAGWEHVNLTSDYIWNTVANVTENHGGLRPLRPIPEVILLAA
jgi:hypothetical protein